MTPGLPDAEYRTLRDTVFSTIWDVLDPLEQQIEDTEKIPHDVVLPALRACGAFGLIVPREYGGAGLSIAQYLPVLAEFAKIQGGIRTLVHVHNSFAHALSEIGSAEQRQQILPGAARGEMSLAFALTEPGNGTGADLSTRARRDGDDYVVDGRKWLITNSDLSLIHI